MSQLLREECRNRLLRAVTPDDFAALRPYLRSVTMPVRQQLFAINAPIKTLYFPETAIGSVTIHGGGRQVEVGLIGREGLIGAAPVLLGADRLPCDGYVQVAGDLLAIEADALLAATGRSPGLHRLLLRSVQVQIVQTAQTAFANAIDTIDVRLARWLLMCRDRLDDDDLHVTHEFLSVMLGVQRSSATLAVQSLDGLRLIRARRGLITILDRDALEAVAQDSYGLAEAEYARLIEGA